MFLFSLGTIVSPKRNWKQCLRKIWGDKQILLWYFPKWPIVYSSLAVAYEKLADQTPADKSISTGCTIPKPIQSSRGWHYPPFEQLRLCRRTTLLTVCITREGMQTFPFCSIFSHTWNMHQTNGFIHFMLISPLTHLTESRSNIANSYSSVLAGSGSITSAICFSWSRVKASTSSFDA